MKSDSSKRLNELMEHFGITQTDIVQKTGIPKSNISMYLSGQRSPRQNRLSDIAEAYGVSEAWLMGYDVPMSCSDKAIDRKKKDKIFSDNDKKLLADFHSLDSQGQETVRYILDNEKKRCEKIAELDDKIKELTIDFSEEFIPEMSIHNYKTRVIHYFQKVSAGDGELFIDSLLPEKYEIPDIPEYKNADYAVKVKGKSMEPDYNDGDILLIHSTSCIEIGSVGIFKVGDSMFVKKRGKDELISLNPSCDNISYTEDTECQGIVVGKISE